LVNVKLTIIQATVTRHVRQLRELVGMYQLIRIMENKGQKIGQKIGQN
jgi:hypothetical protein